MTKGLLRSGRVLGVLLTLVGCGKDVRDIPGNLLGDTNVREFTDAEVASMAQTINNAEIASARSVEPRMTQRDAKEFARAMITSHMAANARMSQLTPEGVVPFDNPVSIALRRLGEEEIRVLTALPSPSLDNSYIVSQVRMHSHALTLIDCAMAPNAENETLSTLLRNMRTEIEAHLLSAQQVQRTLNIPDQGEGTLVRCVDVCATSSEARANAASFPQELKTAICR